MPLSLTQDYAKIFLSYNMQLELTKDCWTFTPRYSDNNTKTYSKQYIGRKNKKKTEHNFNPGLGLIGFSETGPSESFGVRYGFFSRGFRILGKPLNYIISMNIHLMA